MLPKQTDPNTEEYQQRPLTTSSLLTINEDYQETHSIARWDSRESIPLKKVSLGGSAPSLMGECDSLCIFVSDGYMKVVRGCDNLLLGDVVNELRQERDIGVFERYVLYDSLGKIHSNYGKVSTRKMMKYAPLFYAPQSEDKVLKWKKSNRGKPIRILDKVPKRKCKTVPEMTYSDKQKLNTNTRIKPTTPTKLEIRLHDGTIKEVPNKSDLMLSEVIKSMRVDINQKDTSFILKDSIGNEIVDFNIPITMVQNPPLFFTLMEEEEDDESKANLPEKDLKLEKCKAAINGLPNDIKFDIRKTSIRKEDLIENYKTVLRICTFLTPSGHGNNQNSPKKGAISYASEDSMLTVVTDLAVPPKGINKLYTMWNNHSVKGGFGSVFVATDKTTKSPVAIKKLTHRSDRQKHNNLCEIYFLKEALGHPNIVQYKTCWFVNNSEVWLVMEYLRGGTLQDAMKSHKFIDRHIGFVTKHVLQAITFLHSKGFVHRDIKPSNIMLLGPQKDMTANTATVKLIDFGVCADFRNGSKTTMIGTPFFMSPEMIIGEPYSFSVDIWSLGIVILSLLNGEIPFVNSPFMAMYTSSVKGFGHVLDNLSEKTGEEIKSFLRACLVSDPSKRATAEELLEYPWIKRKDLEVGMGIVVKDLYVMQTFNEIMK